MTIPCIQVVNKRHKKATGVYIGRGNRHTRGSPLGNPFKMQAETDRDTVVEQYDQWLVGEMKQPNSPARAELLRLVKIAKAKVANGDGVPLNLVCWSAPKRCHGDVVKRNIEELLASEDVVVVVVCQPATQIKDQAAKTSSGGSGSSNGHLAQDRPQKNKTEKQPPNKTEKQQPPNKKTATAPASKSKGPQRPKQASSATTTSKLSRGAKQPPPTKATEQEEPTAPPPTTTATTTATTAEQKVEELQKRHRKVQKKLRQIEQLRLTLIIDDKKKKGGDQGHAINDDQQRRLDSEPALREDLQEIQEQLAKLPVPAQSKE